MSILNGIGRWLLAVVVIFCLTIWIGVGLLQTTLLNRPMVFGWLQDSKVYDNALSAVLQIKPEGNQSAVDQESFQRAAQAVFTPDYLKQQTEGVLNGVYDWLEGKRPTVTFSIAVDQKRDAYIAALKNELTAQFANLPVCPTRAIPEPLTCIPQGISATDLAAQRSQLDNSEGNFLTTPLTQDDLGNPAASVQWLAALVANGRWMIIALPLIALACAAGFVLLSDNKLQGLATIGKRVFFYTILLAISGVVLWIFGGSMSLGGLANAQSDDGGAILTKIIDPLLQQILPDVGRMLSLFSGGAALTGLAAWIGGRILYKKAQQPLHTAHTPKPNSPPEQPALPPESPPPPTGV